MRSLLLKVNKKGSAENMNHALLLLLLTPPAHETAIYRQRDRERGSKMIATWKFKDNSITLRVDSWRKRGRIEGGGQRDIKGEQRVVKIQERKTEVWSEREIGSWQRDREEWDGKNGEKDE